MVKNTSNSVPPEPAAPSAKGGSLAWLNPGEWLKSILDFVTKNLPQIPKKQRTYVLLAVLGAVVALVVSIILFQAGQYLFGGALVLAALGLLAFAMWCARPPSVTTTGTKPVTAAQTRPTHEWSRVVVKMPGEPKIQNELEGQMQTIRNLAKAAYLDVLRGRKLPPSEPDPNSVRVNVFLADTEDVPPGEACSLFIPDWLHEGMKNVGERGIRFRPNEGVTGCVFAKEKPIGTRRTSAMEEWERIRLEGMGGIGDDTFQLTQAQIRLIDERLRWIVSFPLTVNVANTSHTVGVLNVDGLSEVLSPEEMQTIYNRLKPTVEEVAKRLAGLDKCRITIAVENI